jgi:hypothetical protein
VLGKKPEERLLSGSASTPAPTEFPATSAIEVKGRLEGGSGDDDVLRRQEEEKRRRLKDGTFRKAGPFRGLKASVHEHTRRKRAVAHADEVGRCILLELITHA